MNYAGATYATLEARLWGSCREAGSFKWCTEGSRLVHIKLAWLVSDGSLILVLPAW